ncbi:hypothetical protein BH24ACT15_BH24ACT15_05480 [soil metagenome]
MPSWEQFLDFLCLSFGQDLGCDVEPVRARKQSREDRLEELVRELADSGKLRSSFRVSDAVAPMSIEADLRNRRVTTSVRLPAPRDRQARGRISWMLRQLKDAPADLRVEVSFARTSETTAGLLAAAREDPKSLLSPTDPKRQPRSFILTLTRPLGKKRGRGQGSFIGDTRQHGIEFYRQVVQDLRNWRPPAPKWPEQQSDREHSDEATPAEDAEHADGESEKLSPLDIQR